MVEISSVSILNVHVDEVEYITKISIKIEFYVLGSKYHELCKHLTIFIHSRTQQTCENISRITNYSTRLEMPSVHPY